MFDVRMNDVHCTDGMLTGENFHLTVFGKRPVGKNMLGHKIYAAACYSGVQKVVLQHNIYFLKVVSMRLPK